MHPLNADVLNKMLRARAKDLARRKTNADAQSDLERALGLSPLPPRTDLNVRTSGTLHREGYRVDKLVFESRPGFLATAHLYLPEGAGPFPLVVFAPSDWPYRKSEAPAQAFGIGAALYGMATLLVDPPGRWSDEDSHSERAECGLALDSMLNLGAPALGQYAWDLIRGLDVYAGRPDLKTENVGLVGCGLGGYAATFAAALDHRFLALSLSACAESLEEIDSTVVSSLPGILQAGDVANWLALRAPRPLLVLVSESEEEAAKKTLAKLRELYRKQPEFKNESFLGGKDFSRRMRESIYAFMREHLMGQRTVPYAVELRPMTDGFTNNSVANTVDPGADELKSNVSVSLTLTFSELLGKAMMEPYPQPAPQMPAWGKYGRIAPIAPVEVLHLYDLFGESPGEGSVVMPAANELDYLAANAQGVFIPEFIAQVLHQLLPGGPEGWEPIALGGDALTAMIASVKTLVTKAQPTIEVRKFVGHGPLSSLVARYLVLLRPSTEAVCSHEWSSWLEIASEELPIFIRPAARYTAWPAGWGKSQEQNLGTEGHP